MTRTEKLNIPDLTPGPKFRLAAGLASNLRSFAERLGRRWFQGAATARIAFGPTRPQLA